MKPEELLFIAMTSGLQNESHYRPEKYGTSPKIKIGKVFKSKNILGITPAQYRRLKMSKKLEK